jgi:hypothetical protein
MDVSAPTHKRPTTALSHNSRAHAAGGWKVVPTHFGRIEDLRTDNTTNKNTDQLGYTDAAVDLHTDQPFIAKPPRFQCVWPVKWL